MFSLLSNGRRPAVRSQSTHATEARRPSPFVRCAGAAKSQSRRHMPSFVTRETLQVVSLKATRFASQASSRAQALGASTTRASRVKSGPRAPGAPARGSCTGVEQQQRAPAKSSTEACGPHTLAMRWSSTSPSRCYLHSTRRAQTSRRRSRQATGEGGGEARCLQLCLQAAQLAACAHAA